MEKDDRIIYRISMAHLALRNHIHGLFAEKGLQVTVPQATVLFILKERDGRMMSELGKVLGVDNSAMTGLIDRLEKAGFVRREAAQEDRRALRIRITLEGLEEAKRAAGVIGGVNEKIKTGFKAAQIEAFKDVLGGILEQYKIK